MAVPKPDPRVMAPGTLPTPFTADEIRAGCPDGRIIRMQIEVDGRVVGTRTHRYRDGDAEGTTTESQSFDGDGGPIGLAETERSTWLELQRHASFETDRTTRVAEALDGPLGRLECLHYRRTNQDGSTSDFWFAHAAPGMPIRYRTVAHGRVTTEVVLIENVIPGA
jgi:hypothetical protein